MTSKVMTNKEHVEAILGRTFLVLKSVYDIQRKEIKNFKSVRESRIIFPRKREKELRVSEQELRFVFVEQLNKEIEHGWDVSYSVETPTERAYSGFAKGNPKCDENGRSGGIDLVIHDNKFKRIVLVEFKAHNAKREDYEKDFCKLVNEDAECKYFVNVLEGVTEGTVKSIHEKIKGFIHNGIYFMFGSLYKGKNVTKDIVEYKD